MKTKKRTAKAIKGKSQMQIGFTIAQSITYLKSARKALRFAGAANAADYVQRSIKSAEGALRHARRRAVEERTL